MESAKPRMTEISLRDTARLGCGRRIVLPSKPGVSGPNTTFTELLSASVRVASESARLKGDSGSGFFFAAAGIGSGFFLAKRNMSRRLPQFLAEAALKELRHQPTLELIALVEEAQGEGETDIAEYAGVFSPGYHRARLITVDRSPFTKAVRISSATRTMFPTMRRPCSV